METDSLGLLRTTYLDERNRPRAVVEEQGMLAAPLRTDHLYDEAGNEVSTTDRRGVENVTSYDYESRPVLVVKRVTQDPSRIVDYSANGGDQIGAALLSHEGQAGRPE